MATCVAPRPTRHFSNLPEYCPSPAQIRAACLAIQQEWSPEERASRQMSHGGFALLRLEFLPGSEHPSRSSDRTTRTFAGPSHTLRADFD